MHIPLKVRLLLGWPRLLWIAFVGWAILAGAVAGIVELLKGPEIKDEQEARALVTSFLKAGLIHPESLEVIEMGVDYDPGWRFYELTVRLEARTASGETRTGTLRFKVKEWSGEVSEPTEITTPAHRLTTKDGVFMRDEHGNLMLRVRAPED